MLSNNKYYYPFGSVLYGRNFSAPSYRYAFNGKEKDDEIEGAGDSYDYGKRIYEARLGRFMTVDGLNKKYPESSVYLYASNTPISAIDIDGLEARASIYGAGIARDPETYELTEKNHQGGFKKESERDVEWKMANKAYEGHTNEKLLTTLKKLTKEEGNIEYLSIYSHSLNDIVILDNGQFGHQGVANKSK